MQGLFQIASVCAPKLHVDAAARREMRRLAEQAGLIETATEEFVAS